MSLAFVQLDEAEALRVARWLSAPPRCSHYRWVLDEDGLRRWDRLCGPRGKRGRVPPCLCASATDVHHDCPHVTWQTVAVVRLRDGTAAIGVADPDRYGETRFAGRVAKSAIEESDPVWSAREDRRSVLRPTEPAPPERSARERSPR